MASAALTAEAKRTMVRISEAMKRGPTGPGGQAVPAHSLFAQPVQGWSGPLEVVDPDGR